MFTLSESVIVAIGCISYDFRTIGLATGQTTLLVFLICIYAVFTKTDFTGPAPYLIIFLFLIIFSCILYSLEPLSRPLDYLYSFVFIICFCMFLIQDVQRIVGGRHRKYKYIIDDWVFAALNIYLDIINIFLQFLTMQGQNN